MAGTSLTGYSLGLMSLVIGATEVFAPDLADDGLGPKCERWWGSFRTDRTHWCKLLLGDAIDIINSQQTRHPAVIVGREYDEVSFRCTTDFPNEENHSLTHFSTAIHEKSNLI